VGFAAGGVGVVAGVCVGIVVLELLDIDVFAGDLVEVTEVKAVVAMRELDRVVDCVELESTFPTTAPFLLLIRVPPLTTMLWRFPLLSVYVYESAGE
jgi:hypothetical protein